MDDYADDLAAVMDALDLRGVVLVGHSTAAAKSSGSLAVTAPTG